MPKTHMTADTLQRMIDVINEQRTWIMTRFNPRQIPYLRLIDGNITVSYSQSLDLKVTVAQSGYSKRQMWTIPLFRLEMIVRKLCADDRALARRVKANAMTTSDIERIILDATYGVVNLELEDNTYNPSQL